MKLKDPIDYDRYSCFFWTHSLKEKNIYISVPENVYCRSISKKTTNVYLYSDLL